MSTPRTKAAPKRGSGSPSEEYRAARGVGAIKLRLSLDVLEQLAELADEGDCSRAEVVDSLIRLEWAKSPKRKLRTRDDELAAFVARAK